MSILKVKRLNLNKSIEDIAKHIGLSPREYEEVEQNPNQANAYLVCCICKALSLDFDSL